MTLHEICGIAACNAVAAGIALDGVKLEELALKLNDDKIVKAAAWLKQIIKPELLPEFDPYDVDEERYVLICVNGSDDSILFYRSYPSWQRAHDEMESQYEFAKSEEISDLDGDIFPDSAWLSWEGNKITDGNVDWSILPADKIFNSIDDYTPIMLAPQVSETENERTNDDIHDSSAPAVSSGEER